MGTVSFKAEILEKQVVDPLLLLSKGAADEKNECSAGTEPVHSNTHFTHETHGILPFRLTVSTSWFLLQPQ